VRSGVYERDRLPMDVMLEGPAIVEEDGADDGRAARLARSPRRQRQSALLTKILRRIDMRPQSHTAKARRR
jgi:hypothetical protein